jgi:hypothetical protein
LQHCSKFTTWKKHNFPLSITDNWDIMYSMLFNIHKQLCSIYQQNPKLIY